MLLKFTEALYDRFSGELPPEVVAKAKTAVIAWLGGSLPGADAGIVTAEKKLWESQLCSGPCTVIGAKGKTAPIAAAAINSAMGQVFLQEDCHEKTLSHPGVIVIPAALAVGQAVRASGMDVIRAVCAGYEAMGRIGKCLIKPGFHAHGLRPAAILGPFGSCVAAGLLLGLDPAGLRDAISVAGNYAAGVTEFVHTSTPDICIQNCFSAKSGVMAAYEAKNGLCGAPTILDGTNGLGWAFNNSACDWSPLADCDGYEIMDTFIKTYPGCGHVLPTAQAAMDIVAKRTIDPESIVSGRIGCTQGAKDYPGCDSKGPFDGIISAMMSHQFAAACALINKHVSIDDVKNYADPRVAELARRFSVEVDPQVCALEESGGRVDITLKNGEKIESFQERILPLSEEGARARLLANGRGFYSQQRLERLLEQGEAMEKLDDICGFADLIESDL